MFVRREQPGAHREQLTEVLGQAFVNPEQACPFRLMKARRHHRRRATIFPAPRMHKFMRQQIRGPQFAFLVIDQIAFAHFVETALQMLEPVARKGIAAHEQKVISELPKLSTPEEFTDG